MFETLIDEIHDIRPRRRLGRVVAADSAALTVAGLELDARLGDGILVGQGETALEGEIVALGATGVRAMTYAPIDGLALGAAAQLRPMKPLCPGPGWLGRVIDAFGRPLDGEQLPPGPAPAALRRAPPPAADRRGLGARLGTGLAAFDTMLPLAQGQRIGIFAGSGIGKSSLLADLARGVEAERVVLVLIGERGREVGGFLRDALSEAARARMTAVVATSDESPLIKRRAAWTGMAVAEAYRDQGAHVLFLMDSLTRFAEAHREVALTAGEPPSLRAYPPSTAALIAGLAERAGPGRDARGEGDITGVFTVLVAGSDMEEPVADITRGILDGHVILDRTIAERGRFPAIDVRRSVSRSLPEAASEAENALIAAARKHLGVYDQALPMIQTGLYQPGSDDGIDAAMRVFPALDALIGAHSESVAESFEALRAALAAAEEERGVVEPG